LFGEDDSRLRPPALDRVLVHSEKLACVELRQALKIQEHDDLFEIFVESINRGMSWLPWLLSCGVALALRWPMIETLLEPYNRRDHFSSAA
jgi:hypothetical protein